VAREYNIPAIFNTQEATRVLRNGMLVTVDAVFGNVYEGKVDEVLSETWSETDFENSPVMVQLKNILSNITPLNLSDPRSPDFVPDKCKTLHDITRFAHEVSLRTIFDLTKESHFADQSAKQLVSDLPLKWWVIDLEDGLSPTRGKKVSPEHILSIPLKALWAGMVAKPWKGPPPVSAKGFMEATFSDPGDQDMDRRFVDRNYMLVAKNFCNVSTRLGFHFSTMEAYVGEEENLNYLSLFYTGGGADSGRKNRRAGLIARLLETYDFRVEKKDDTVFARLEGHTRPFLEARLKILGHTMTHTRQMDMVMYNDAMVDFYFKEMSKDLEAYTKSD
jgi:pyruvate,water dikinase